MAAASAEAIRPTSASARASAASTSSRAASQAGSARAVRTGPRPSRPSKRPRGASGSRADGSDPCPAASPSARASDVEEDRLTFSLQTDVEPVAVAGPRGQECRTLGPVEAAEDRILAVAGIVGEVEARDQSLEQPAGEDHHVEMGCLLAAFGRRDATRSEGEDGVAALVVGG